MSPDELWEQWLCVLKILQEYDNAFPYAQMENDDTIVYDFQAALKEYINERNH